MKNIYHQFILKAISTHPTLSGLLNTTFDEELNRLWSEAERLAASGLSKSTSNKGLLSAFDALSGANKSYFAPNPLSLDKSNFPQSGQQSNSVATNEVTIKTLIAQAPTIANAETLLFCLQQYSANLPCAYHEAISWYDFTKTVIAIGVCLSEADSNMDKPFLLVAGGVSGIQNYLYDIVSSRASKNLKGRSFYVQLLADAVVAKLLNDFKLYQANVIYASGGGFMLLVPANRTEPLEKAKTAIVENLFEMHRTQLSFQIDRIAIAKSALEAQQFGELKRELETRLDQQKRQKYKEKISGDYSFFFKKSEIGGIEERDAITNEEIEGKKYYLNKEEQTSPVNRVTYHQVQLGALLRETDYIGVSDQPLSLWGRSEEDTDYWRCINPGGIGVYYHLLEDKKDVEKFITANQAANAKVSGVYRLNDCLNFVGDTTKEIVYGFLFYAGNEYPTYKDEKGQIRVKEFSMLAGEENIRFKRLGVLRMDVDGLGTLLRQTFEGTNNAFPNSIAAFSTLSRQLDWFFKGYLNTLWASNDLFKSEIQLVYAGGDDLFAVGKWDTIIDFAKIIREDFNEYVCKYTGLSISAGVAVVTSSFPIIKAAERAGHYEDVSKDHQCKGLAKNSITLFGVPFHWDQEYKSVEKLKGELVEHLLSNKINKGLLSKIMGLHEQAEEQRRNERTQSWRWRISYFLARTEEATKEPVAKTLIGSYKTSILTDKYDEVSLKETNYTFFDYLFYASIWADLASRSKESSL